MVQGLRSQSGWWLAAVDRAGLQWRKNQKAGNPNEDREMGEANSRHRLSSQNPYMFTMDVHTWVLSQVVRSYLCGGASAFQQVP